MDPRFVSAMNNLGVLETRSNNDQAAARDFDAALAINRMHPAALHNAAYLYQRVGDTRHAALLRERLERSRKRDPFYQFMQGVLAERAGNYPQASHFYRAAIDLYPRAHQFHFGLARTYFLTGNNRQAEREMTRARALGGTNEVRAIYQAKLDSLRRLDPRHAVRDSRPNGLPPLPAPAIIQQHLRGEPTGSGDWR